MEKLCLNIYFTIKSLKHLEIVDVSLTKVTCLILMKGMKDQESYSDTVLMK